MQLARIHNVVPSLLLVLVGAWAGTGRSAAALLAPAVWVMGILTGSLAVSSCVVNDYFDLRVDRRNAPDKPLVSGAVTTDTALLLTVALYCSVLIVACFMEDIHLRSIIALSAGATLLYTPVFKKLTAVKNATVATMIALAPLAGALAAGAGEIGVRRLLPATLFAFSGVMFREIVMDLNDLEGDKESGIATLPVLLGKGYALLCALGCAFAGGAAALWAATHGAMAAGAPAALAVSGAIVGPAAVVAGALARLTHLAMRIYSSKFDRSTVKWAIDECLKPVGLSLILLAGLMA